jgi:hypothetical protein
MYMPQEQGGSVIPQALGFLFVTSYDSQGYGGDIRPRPRTGLLCIKAEVLILKA